MKKILIITVNYQNTDPTFKLIKSIEKCNNTKTIQLVIVDNGSTMKSKKELLKFSKESFLSCFILESESNKFYWGGANFALENLLVNNGNYEWIIICNNDILFDDNQFFDKLLNQNKKIIAPKIISSTTKNDLNPFMLNPISFVQDIYYSFYYMSYFTSKIFHKLGRLIKSLKKKMIYKNFSNYKIYAPHGSCIIFNKDFFENGGLLDTGFTMYGEEVSTAEIAKKINSLIYYIPSLSIIHNEHQSTRESSLKDNFLHSKETYYYLKKKYRS
jgi:GT2 family glycosyltransferase